MHSTELRTSLLKLLRCSGGLCSITELQGPENHIIGRPSPTTWTSPYRCAWPTPSTRLPVFPRGCGCRAAAGARSRAPTSWDPGVHLPGVGLGGRGYPYPQDTRGRLRNCDGTGGRCSGATASSERPAAPGYRSLRRGSALNLNTHSVKVKSTNRAGSTRTLDRTLRWPIPGFFTCTTS